MTLNEITTKLRERSLFVMSFRQSEMRKAEAHHNYKAYKWHEDIYRKHLRLCRYLTKRSARGEQ